MKGVSVAVKVIKTAVLRELDVGLLMVEVEVVDENLNGEA